MMIKSLDNLNNNISLKKNINIVVDTFLIFLALLSSAKLFILGLTIDEEYAVAMSYRNVMGDRMFIDMWEPHQTSGFICSFLIRLFMMVTGGTDYLVIFLRISGFVIECFVAAFVFFTFRKRLSGHLSFGIAMLAFLVLPKQMLTPDFSNILIWSTLCLMMSLIRISLGNHAIFWSIISGLFVCLCVLAYPSLIVAALLISYCIYRLANDKKLNCAISYLVTCAVTGLSYVGYFLSHMSLNELLFGIRQMMSDGSHSNSAVKINWMLSEFKSWIIPLLIIFIVTAIIYLIVKKDRKSTATWMMLLAIVSVIHQMVFWCMSSNQYLNEPLLFYYIVFFALSIISRKNSMNVWSTIVPSVLIWVSVLAVTNTGFRVTGTFLLPGIICLLPGICTANERVEETAGLRTHGMLLCFLIIFLLLFERGYLVIENQGYKAYATYVKQKALSGPCENIYCRYNDGFDYNTVSELLGDYSQLGDTLLILEAHSSWYMLSDAMISTYSTISTPTFDERLLYYWEMYPERFPTLVIAREDVTLDNSFLFKDSDFELIEARNGIALYRIEQ